MANFDGFLISNILVQDATDISTTAKSMEALFDEVAWLPEWWFTGTKTYVVDTQYPQRNYTGLEVTAFSDLFYNRIWILPAHLNLNGVPNNYSTSVIVWNAYFVNKNLTSIIPTNIVGINLGGPTSHTFNPLATQSYTVTLTPAVPPKVDGNYQFIFSDAEDPFLTLAGTISDIVALPHDWNQSVKERVAYLTNVIEAHSGKEQRIQLRKYPRRQYTYRVWTATNDLPLEQGVLKIHYHNKMAYGMGKTFVLPIWTDYQVLAQDLSIGTTNIPVITGNYDYFVGGFVAIMRDYLTYDVLSITTVNPTSLVVNAPGTSREWRKGDTIVPVRVAEIGQELVGIDAFTNTAEGIDEVWDVLVTDNLVDARVVNDTPANIYKGYEVYLEKSHDYSSDGKNEIYQTLRTLDNQTGIPKQDRRYDFTRERTTVNFAFETRLELAQFLGFLERRQGKLNPFWYPTFGNDFQVTNSGNISDSAFDVKFIGHSQYVQEHPARRDVMFVTKAGVRYFRRIVSSSDNGDGTEKINIDTPLGIAWTPDTFDYVCYLRWVRLDNDIIEISWPDSTGATTQLQIVDLLNSPV